MLQKILALFDDAAMPPPLNLLDFHAEDLKHYSVIEVSPLFLFAGSLRSVTIII